MAATLDVVWSQRERGWFVHPPSRPGEWVRLAGHHTANASDLELLETARRMFMPADVRGAQLRRLEPVHRLPKANAS